MRKLKDHGYTFMESIFQLLLLTVFVHFLLLFFSWKGAIEEQYSDYTTREWELFSAELQQMLTEVSEIHLPFSSSMKFKNERGIITIEKSGTVIRKRVGGEGHVPLLTNVRSASFTFDGVELTVAVTFVDHSVKRRGFVVGLYPM
ncbi:ComGF family competence protein [Sporosarcina sp. ACRSM]|uniref:competence type IV pilus minor pilin ComGF n=1 Tax=Sporosarcina sp. ACRSM TaxID=2918216 RepID=UPI001EF66F2E|nr:competence type IV pilus minor pilin ComGF [Sporosarcina sp. ACRSM]MCG7336366.1 ComGF family competence protein [Sporosarcina sp. ACRSM]